MSKATLAVWKQLAGRLYEDLVQRKEFALACLDHENQDVRIAAINIYNFNWKGTHDPEFLEVCRRLAADDPNETVRSQAIEILGRALESSRDVPLSRLLAAIVKDKETPPRVRGAAYWALRGIQSTLTAEDSTRRMFCAIKLGSHNLTTPAEQEQLKRDMLASGQFPESLWDSADEIDWEFVEKFASPAADESK